MELLFVIVIMFFTVTMIQMISDVIDVKQQLSNQRRINRELGIRK